LELCLVVVSLALRVEEQMEETHKVSGTETSPVEMHPLPD